MTPPGDLPPPTHTAGVHIRLYKVNTKTGSRCSGISVNGKDYRVGRGPDTHIPELGRKFAASPQNVALLLIIAEHFDHSDQKKKRVDTETLLAKMHDLGRKLPEEVDSLYQHNQHIFKGGPFSTSGKPGTLSWPSVTFEVVPPGLGVKRPPPPQRPHNQRAATQLFGRDKEVTELETHLSLPVEERCAVVVSGGPGFGKSYLLDHVYLKHRHDLFRGGQVIVPMPLQDLSNADDLLEQTYSYIIGRWNISHSGTDRWSILAHYLREKSVFVCIENIDTPQAADVASKVAVLLHGCILVLEGRMAGEIAEVNHLPHIQLNELSRESSIDLLQAETTSRRRLYERKELDTLAERLGDHPLALHIAATNLGDPEFKTVSDFLKRLDDNFEIEVQQSDFLRSLQQDRGASNLAATFLLALKGLEKAFRDPAPRYIAGLAAISFGPLDRMGEGLCRALSGLDDDQG